MAKPYRSLDTYLKETFGHKLYKLALDGGMTCPNRDGTVGTGGCIFCSERGSGDFTPGAMLSVSEQISEAKKLVENKLPENCGNVGYIAYFQSFTNTYAPVSRLEKLFTEAIMPSEVEVLSVATRPDCLQNDVLDLLERLNKIKPVWVELGLQTSNEATAKLINRNYELPCFERGVRELQKRNIQVIVHVIIGLPGETRTDLLNTVEYLNKFKINGIKLQLLHVLKNTALAEMSCTVPELDEYTDLLIDCIEHISPDTVIHRITGDGPKKLLIAPLWSGDKKRVMNYIHKTMRERGAYQGKALGMKNIFA